MAQSLAERLIEAGVHFGHRASRWNPKMAPYIYARKNGIHIIDVRETIRGLVQAPVGESRVGRPHREPIGVLPHLLLEASREGALHVGRGERNERRGRGDPSRRRSRGDVAGPHAVRGCGLGLPLPAHEVVLAGSTVHGDARDTPRPDTGAPGASHAQPPPDFRPKHLVDLVSRDVVDPHLVQPLRDELHALDARRGVAFPPLYIVMVTSAGEAAAPQ